MSQMVNNNTQVENLPSSSSTIVEELSPTSSQTIQLSLQKRKNSKKVVFTEDTVDNENLNRKKSKCCCIYEKPRTFDESESESEEDCENCYGHKNKKKPDNETSI